MKIAASLVMLALTLTSACAVAQSEEIHRWPVMANFFFVQNRLCHASGFVPIDSLADLPPALRSKLTNLADRGEPYNETDVIDKPAPTQRFIIGATNGELMLLAIDAGGFAPMKRLDTYFMQSGEWEQTQARDIRLARKDYATVAQLLDEARKVFECSEASAR